MGRMNQPEPESQAPTRIVRQIFHLIYCQITVTERRRKWLTINWRNDTNNGAERLLAETSNASSWTKTWSRYVHWIATFLPRALVLRNEHGRVLPMQPLSSILRETARRIDANAKSLAKPSTPKNTQLVVVELKTLTACLANLCSYEDETKGHHGLGLHLLPFTIGNWIAEIRMQDVTKGWKTTEEKLMGIFQQFSVSERFRYVAVHQSYAGLSLGWTPNVKSPLN